MRLSPGLRPLGIALSLAMALPCIDGGMGPVEAETVVAQNTAARGSSRKAKSAASTQAKEADGKSGRAPADVDRQLDAAAKSLGAGNADAAMSSLDSILASGGLANKHMARALYLRGVTHRKKGRPAQAIADLTSAIWLKDGLTETDRAAALKERGEISREIGVAEAAPPGAAPTPSSPSSAATSSPATTQEPPRQTSLLSAPSSSSFPVAGFPEYAQPRRRQAAPGETGQSPSQNLSKSTAPVTSSWESKTQPEPRSTVAGSEPVRGVPKLAPPSRTPSGSGEGLGQFFSGLFGGGSEPSPSPKTTKGASWSTSTSAEAPTQRKRGPEATGISTSAVHPATSGAAGAYRLQIATLRSRKEADAVVARVRKDHGRVVGPHKLDVDETVYGNMGTFYRVRLGPFASANEPKALCDQLRPQGYDCLVVTN